MDDINNENSFDMLKMFQKAKDMSDIMNLSKNTSNDTNEDNLQKQSETIDFEKMMKTMEMAKILNSYMNVDKKKDTGEPHTEQTEPPHYNNYKSVSGLSLERKFTPEYLENNIESPALKTMKAALPYIEFKYRRNLSIFIKIIEIQRLLDVYGNAVGFMRENSGKDWQRGLLVSIRPHLEDNKKSMIDILLKLMDMKLIMNSMSMR